MKKIFLIIICCAICVLFGCSKKADEPSPSISSLPPSAATEYQASPSPTPNPTLSEEEKENINKYNELLNLCIRYHDWSAALLIKAMYEEGKITKNQYFELFSIDAFSEAKDYDDEFWNRTQSYIDNMSNVLNEVNYSAENIQSLSQTIGNAVQQGSVYIAIFDSQEKVDRVSQGLTCIDNWLEESSEEKFNMVMDFLNSQELSTDEKVTLYCYLSYNSNLPEEINSNGNKKTINEYFIDNGLENYLDTLG